MQQLQQSQNVSLAGSGGVPLSPLSTLCVSRAVAAAFVVLGIPTCAFAAAMWQAASYLLGDGEILGVSLASWSLFVST